MRQAKSRGRRLTPVLLTLFLCLSATVPQGIALAQPETFAKPAAAQAAPLHRLTLEMPTAGKMPVHRLLYIKSAEAAHFPGTIRDGEPLPGPHREPRLISLHGAACHASCHTVHTRPLSELAFRTGGHAPP